MRVFLLEPRLVHVLMRVLGPVVMGVRMLVPDVVVFVCGVHVDMGLAAVAVFVHVGFIVVVLFSHCDPLIVNRFPASMIGR